MNKHCKVIAQYFQGPFNIFCQDTPCLVMNGVILGYDDDGDHVPELGVKGVHEHLQSLQEDTKIRT